MNRLSERQQFRAPKLEAFIRSRAKSSREEVEHLNTGRATIGDVEQYKIAAEMLRDGCEDGQVAKHLDRSKSTIKGWRRGYYKSFNDAVNWTRDDIDSCRSRKK